MRPSPLFVAAHNGAPEWGGAEIALSRLLRGLQERGHRVVLYCGRTLVAERAAEYGIPVVRLRVGGDAALHHTLRVARRLRRDRPDVLVVGTFRKLLHLSAGARLAGVPVVARIGLSTDVPRNAKYRFLFRRWVDRVVVNARDLREAYLEALPELDPGRVVVAGKGVEPPHLPPRSEARAELGLEPDVVVVGALARLVEQKRLDRFVDVLARMPPGVAGLVAGDGPLRRELEARAAEREASVRLVGHRDDIGTVLAATDVLLLTSDRESLANAMLEALASGVPVVSTPVSGAREALDGLENGAPPGLVTDGFTVEELTRTLGPLVRDAGLRARMAEAARLRSARRFGRDAMLDRWEAALRDVACDGAGATSPPSPPEA